MKLTTDTLPEYFTIAGPTNSHYTRPTNCFNFVDRNSDCLVVTVGDSWTWGSNLNIKNRLEQVYGNLIAAELEADFLNLGQAGSNNFFIAERVEELAKIVPQLGYAKIYLICTFTETGRSFNSHHDMYINYTQWFEQNSIEDFLAFLNQECYNRIHSVAQQHNMILRVGTNFVDPIGFPVDVIPWFRQLGIECPISACAGSTGVTRLADAGQFTNNQIAFKTWFSKLVDYSLNVDQVCQSKLLINSHPDANGHITWANSIVQTLK